MIRDKILLYLHISSIVISWIFGTVFYSYIVQKARQQRRSSVERGRSKESSNGIEDAKLFSSDEDIDAELAMGAEAWGNLQGKNGHMTFSSLSSTKCLVENADPHICRYNFTDESNTPASTQTLIRKKTRSAK